MKKNKTVAKTKTRTKVVVQAKTTPSRAWPFWVGIGVPVVIFLFLISGILLPFVVGIMVAYFLDPAADKLEEWGLSRTLATLFITTLFFSVMVTALSVLLPIIYDQLEILLRSLPQAIVEQQDKLKPVVTHWLYSVDPQLSATFSTQVKSLYTSGMTYVLGFVTGVMQSGIALLNLLSLIFVTPVVAFYFLRDWDRMIERIHRMLPRRHAATIREQMGKADETLSGFLRGQTNVCLLLGIFYAIGLTLAGLQGGMLIGLFTGIATFIPYVGMLVGTVVGLVTAYMQFGTWEGVALVAAIFAVGQIIEGNFVAPTLVGDKVGLHPVWLIFGMLAGGKLFGFLGVLLAVPVTAVLGVLVRFLVGVYLESRYYKA